MEAHLWNGCCCTTVESNVYNGWSSHLSWNRLHLLHTHCPHWICSLGEAEPAFACHSAVHIVAYINAGPPSRALGSMPWRDSLTSVDDGLRNGDTSLVGYTNVARNPPTTGCAGCWCNISWRSGFIDPLFVYGHNSCRSGCRCILLLCNFL